MRSRGVDTDELVVLLRDAARACLLAVDGSATDWSATGGHRGQHRGDVVADSVACERLDRPWLNVLSEESGLLDRGAVLTAIVDPIDGSTNASRGLLPWASSIAVVDDEGPLVAVVALCRSLGTYWAIRGRGAWRDGTRVRTSGAKRPESSVIAVNGTPRAWLGWSQLRAFGSAASELAFVAEGSVDALVDFSRDGLAVWDVAAGALLVAEAGGYVVTESGGPPRLDPFAQRQHLVAGATEQLASELLRRRERRASR